MRISDWISDVCSSDLPISMPVEYRTLAESQPHRDNPGSSCRSFDSIPHGQPSRPSSQQTIPNRSSPPPSGRRGKIEEIQGNLRSEEHTSELQSLMRNSYAVLCLKKKQYTNYHN